MDIAFHWGGTPPTTALNDVSSHAYANRSLRNVWDCVGFVCSGRADLRKLDRMFGASMILTCCTKARTNLNNAPTQTAERHDPRARR